MRMYYHGSPVGGIGFLEPKVATFREEDACVYLSSRAANAVIYCRRCHMYPYGFDEESGLLQYDEPYPDCLKDLYAGKSGYLYQVEEAASIEPMKDIRDGYASRHPLRIRAVEFIEDIHEKLLEYAAREEIILVRFKDVSERTRDYYHRWVVKTLSKPEVYHGNSDYARFLKEKFPTAWKEARANRIRMNRACEGRSDEES